MSSTNRGAERYPDDFYETPGWCVRALLKNVNLPGGNWFEPAVGTGAIVEAVKCFRRDICWRINDINEDRVAEFIRNRPGEFYFSVMPYSTKGIKGHNYFDVVITNPPYNQAMDFVQGAMKDGKIVVMLLRLNWLASKARNRFLLDNPPSVYVLPKRPCFTGDGKTDSCEYAWFVWGLEDTPTVHILDIGDCE